MPKLDTNSISNARTYLRERCPPDARPIIRSLLEVIGAQSDANRHLRLDIERLRAAAKTE